MTNAFQIRGYRFKMGDTIGLLWKNQAPTRLDVGVITHYDHKRGRCCLQVNGRGWINPRHPYVSVYPVQNRGVANA